jgi:ATP-binding cassette, subfamily A (ABC1), member 5
LILEEIRKEYAKPSNINKYMKCGVKRKTNEELSENKSKIAVRNMCLSFKKGEIFGLLGPNGAGKSTTINIITTDLRADSGVVNVCGEALNLANLKTFYENASFCPQINPFWEEITLREHLELYACIKQIPEYLIFDKCNE